METAGAVEFNAREAHNVCSEPVDVFPPQPCAADSAATLATTETIVVLAATNAVRVNSA